ncbi:PEP-CTERM sorting domain-containing protein [Duganella fentianensis]|uniref:PEP-CTERM sorting domain-containing protein n=1 Tax=Duganella fentianensis TaxID=2692177 RepID=UPI001E30FA89|nr:PEP-CTERM sorting domain-containing protein [Duganella fentianensis]
MNFVKKIALAAAITVTLACTANATPLKYEIKGTGSGSLGGTTFSNQAFDISFIGDAAGTPDLIDPLTSAQIAVSGLGTATLNIATRVGLAGTTIVYFSHSESQGGLDLFDFRVLTPISSLNSVFTVAGTDIFALDQFKNISSTLGNVTLESSSDVVFSSSDVSAVPEPETYALMLAGMGLIGVAARRKASKQAA